MPPPRPRTPCKRPPRRPGPPRSTDCPPGDGAQGTRSRGPSRELALLWQLPNTRTCIWCLTGRFPFHKRSIPQNFKNHSHYKMLFLHIIDTRLNKIHSVWDTDSQKFQQRCLNLAFVRCLKAPLVGCIPPTPEQCNWSAGAEVSEVVVVQSPSCVRLLQTHGLQHVRLPCPSPSPKVCSNSCPLWPRCHPTVSSSALDFSQRRGLFQWVGSLHQAEEPLSELQHQFWCGLYVPFQCGIAFFTRSLMAEPKEMKRDGNFRCHGEPRKE